MSSIVVVLGDGAWADSHEFIATYPDGTRGAIWSPPWNACTPEEELAGAKLAAQAFWDHRGEPDFQYIYEGPQTKYGNI